MDMDGRLDFCHFSSRKSNENRKKDDLFIDFTSPNANERGSKKKDEKSRKEKRERDEWFNFIYTWQSRKVGPTWTMRLAICHGWPECFANHFAILYVGVFRIDGTTAASTCYAYQSWKILLLFAVAWWLTTFSFVLFFSSNIYFNKLISAVPGSGCSLGGKLNDSQNVLVSVLTAEAAALRKPFNQLILSLFLIARPVGISD